MKTYYANRCRQPKPGLTAGKGLGDTLAALGWLALVCLVAWLVCRPSI
jgi:hypothetical protein